jgi:hypothetical protein
MLERVREMATRLIIVAFFKEVEYNKTAKPTALTVSRESNNGKLLANIHPFPFPVSGSSIPFHSLPR